MAVTRHTGPHVVSEGQPPPLGMNEDQVGGSIFAHGVGLAVPFILAPGGGDVSNTLPYWYACDQIMTTYQIPATLAANNIVASAVPVAGTPMTLAGASTGIVVVGAPGFQLGSGSPLVPAGSLAIDGLPALTLIAGSQGGTTAIDPRTSISRAVRVTSVGNDSTAQVTIRGYDLYCQPVIQTLTGGNVGAVTTTKAFKFISSVTWSGTLSGSAVTVGTTDVYGFPLACQNFSFATLNWAGAAITATTGFVAAAATDPATAATGDVRGTYATQSASNGTNRLIMSVTPQPWDLATFGTGGTNSGLFGVRQYST